MTGTMHVIAALYTTLNVAGPNGATLTDETLAQILMLLVFAAVLTVIGIYLEARPKRRSKVKGPAVTSLRRQARLGKPAAARRA